MIKYPSVYTVREFASIIRGIPELLDLEGYVEPKYDGSNITCFAESCLTRNHNPLPEYYMQGLRRALGSKWVDLKRLMSKYQVFLELGGERNSPAGYSRSWRGEWDYRIFDLYAGAFFEPPKVEDIVVREYGLEFVGYRVVRVEDVVNEWKSMLGEYEIYEGFVLKVFPDQSILRKIKHHRQGNMVIAKFKHEYGGVSFKPRKREQEEAVSDNKQVLENSEILGVINKVHMELGMDFFEAKKAMPVIFERVREEARKHGVKAPRPNRVYALYRKYVEKVKKE